MLLLLLVVVVLTGGALADVVDDVVKVARRYARRRWRPLLTLRIVAGEIRDGCWESAAFELVVGLAGPITCRLLNRHNAGCRGGACLPRHGRWPRRSWL